MARIQKGGVCTQEVNKKVFSLLAVFVMFSAGALAFIVDNDDDSSATYSIDSSVSFVKAGNSVTFTIKNESTDTVYCNWYLYNSSGTSQKNGTFTISANSTYDQDVTTPSTAGDYRFVVKYYNDSEKGTDHFICERERHVKAVDPVKITITLENSSATSYSMVVYLEINAGSGWVKQDDSEKTITVSAYDSETGTKGTGTYTFEYVVEGLPSTTSYRLNTDNEDMKEVVSGFGTEFKFYTYQNSYDFITGFMVVVLLILVIVGIWIYRKPVKNFGKPKARK